MKDLISICIATYNVEKYIVQCLNSIRDIEINIYKEIIIIDDVSTDNTVIVVQDWIQKNPSIRTILEINIKNLGPGGTYNRASKIASGEYITFLDSDDFLINPSFEKKLQYFKENQKLKIVYGDGLFYEKGIYGLPIQNNIQKLFYRSLYNIQKQLYLTIPMLSVSTALIKKEFFDTIDGFDGHIRSNDWILNIKIFKSLKSKNEFDYCDIKGFAYRLHDSNISKNQDKMIELLSQVVNAYFPKKYKNHGLSNIYFYVSLNYLLSSEYQKSFLCIKKSLNYKKDTKRLIIWILSIPGLILIKIIPTKRTQFLKKLFQRFFQ